MMNDKSNRAELKIQIDEDGAVDVYINGTTESLVYAICAAIRSISYNLADNIDIEEFKSTLSETELKEFGLADISREDLSQYFEPMILKEVIDNLDSIGDTRTDIPDINVSDGDTFTKLEFEVDENFDPEKFKSILDECISELMQDNDSIKIDDISTNVFKDGLNSNGLNFDVFDREKNENEEGDSDE